MEKPNQIKESYGFSNCLVSIVAVDVLMETGNEKSEGQDRTATENGLEPLFVYIWRTYSYLVSVNESCVWWTIDKRFHNLKNLHIF